MDMSYEGAYVPAFFKILLKFPSDLIADVNKPGDEEYLATFVHEYVHFLQDITTASGVSRIVFIHKLLQAYLHEAAKCSNIIPFPINWGHIQNFTKEKELESYYDGFDEYKKIHHINKVTCERYEYEDVLCVDDPQFVVNIYYDDKEEPYVFGRICVLESMAYLCERAFDAEIRTKVFPYNTCEILCEYLYPKMLKYPNVLAAMCEISLMHYNSGLQFYIILMDMKVNRKIYCSVEEFEKEYKYRCDFLWENYCLKLQELIETINYLYPNGNIIFGECNSVLNSMFATAKNMRLGDDVSRSGLFISRMIEAPSLIKQYLLRLNSVMIIDDSKEIKSVSGLERMLIPYAVLKIFAEHGSKCAIYDYCVNNNSKKVDDVCLNEPWKKCQKEEKECCPFAAFWYMFSLEGKVINKKK